VVLAAVAFILVPLGAGAWLAAVAFTTGLAAEALVVALTPSPSKSGTPLSAAAAEEDLLRLLSVSFPLMLNVMLWWGTPLLISSVLARTARPDQALAAFTIVEAVAWFLAAPVGQFQQASIALVHGRESHRKVRLWAASLSALVCLTLVVAALPAVRDWILWAAFRPEPALLATAGAALPIAALYPLLYGHRQYVQGLFVRAGCPGSVGKGAVLRVVIIALAARILLAPLGENGAVLGVALAVIGLAAENLYLEWRSRSRALPALENALVLPPEAIGP
jgi:Na+-driven multidrug efflux pump